MAKSTNSKKTAPKSGTKSKAAFSDKNASEPIPSAKNVSKYQPTKDAIMNEQLLDPQDGLQKLFLDSIKDLYWAENHLIKSLPKMSNAASSKTLQKTINNHLQETKKQVERLEQVFQIVGKKAQAKKCEAMDGILKEADEILESSMIMTLK